jgi:hypothetical protein
MNTYVNFVWAKSLFTSKTFWANVAMIIVTLVDYATTANLPIVGEQWWPLVVALVNIVLRKFTTQPVVMGSAKQVAAPVQQNSTVG